VLVINDVVSVTVSVVTVEEGTELGLNSVPSSTVYRMLAQQAGMPL